MAAGIDATAVRTGVGGCVIGVTLVSGNTTQIISESHGDPTMLHRLKILPEFYQAVSDGRKRFELRKDDRGFSTGDTLMLCEWDGNSFTGRECQCQIDYVLRDYDGLEPGYAILGITPFSGPRT